MKSVKSVPCPAAVMSVKPVNKLSTRRPWTVFTQHQLSVLMDTFGKNNLPERDVIKELATKLNLDNDVIKVWFKNQCAKWKKKQLRIEQGSSHGTSTQQAFTKEQVPLQHPATNTSPSPTTLDGHNHDLQELSDKMITKRDGTSVLHSLLDTGFDDMQDKYLEDLGKPWAQNLCDTYKFVKLFDLPGEDNPSTLDIYHHPGCF